MIIKQRFSKKYRHSSLDSKLTQARFKQVRAMPESDAQIRTCACPACSCPRGLQEVRASLKARKLGVLTPVIYFAEHEASTIYMEKLEARTVKEMLMPGVLDPAGKLPACSHSAVANLGDKLSLMPMKLVNEQSGICRP